MIWTIQHRRRNLRCYSIKSRISKEMEENAYSHVVDFSDNTTIH